MEIKHIDRYYSDLSGYTYYVVYQNGDGEQVPGYDALSKDAKMFMATANYEFRQNKYTGTYYHRFS